MYNVDREIGSRINKLTLAKITIRQDSGRNIKWGLFDCDCGKQVFQKKSKAKSCGCSHTRQPGESARHKLFLQYKKAASVKNRIFLLDEKDFNRLTIVDCFYCGSPPANATKFQSHGDYIHNGIDRINNAIGYTLDNCVACCKDCNYCKGKLEQNDFITQMIKISNHRRFYE